MKVLVQPVEHAYSIYCNEFHHSTQSASNIIPIHLFTSAGTTHRALQHHVIIHVTRCIISLFICSLSIVISMINYAKLSRIIIERKR